MIKTLNIKYKDVIPYIIFGILTTLVNIIIYYFFAHIFKVGVMPSTIIAWILAVLFAYVTNRKWVFHSEENSKRGLVKEIVSFFVCRLSTGFIDWACMYIFVDLLNFNDLAIKIIANFIVIILNYIASKWVIFRKKGNELFKKKNRIN